MADSMLRFNLSFFNEAPDFPKELTSPSCPTEATKSPQFSLTQFSKNLGFPLLERGFYSGLRGHSGAGFDKQNDLTHIFEAPIKPYSDGPQVKMGIAQLDLQPILVNLSGAILLSSPQINPCYKFEINFLARLYYKNEISYEGWLTGLDVPSHLGMTIQVLDLREP